MAVSAPLDKLIARIRRAGIGQLSDIAQQFASLEGYQAFLDLCVRPYLPEHEQEILALPGPAAQIRRFSELFGPRYFPFPDEFLDDDGWLDEQGNDAILRSIPIIAQGISYDDWHGLDFRPGYLLLFSLVESPFAAEHDDGGRTPLLEKCGTYVPQELLERIPRGGWPCEQLVSVTQGTRFAAVGLTAQWVWHASDTGFLDWDWEDADRWQTDWHGEAVEYLTRGWDRGEEILGSIHKLSEWLEKNQETNFRDLLNFILRRVKYGDVPDPEPAIQLPLEIAPGPEGGARPAPAPVGLL